MQNGQTLRVAMVGAGMISAYHLKAWAKIADARVVGLVEPDAARGKARAAEFGITRAYPDLEALLAKQEVDALDIASPRETHAALVREAAARGIDVMCQKPLAPTLAEAEALVRDVAGSIRLMVHENWRFRPYYRQIADWIAEGRFGTLSSGSIAAYSSGLLPDASGSLPTLIRQPFFAGETRLLVAESLIHQIDVARWLFGPLRAVGSRKLRTSDAVVGETVATLLFECAVTGAPLTVHGNMTCPGLPPSSRDRVFFAGSRGTVTMADDRLELLGPRPEAIRYEHESAYQESFDRVIAHFAAALRSGSAFETDAVENLETLRLVEAAYAAS